MTPQRYRRLCQTLDRRQPDLTLLADGLHKLRNIAAIVRTCDAVGIHEMHAVLPEGGWQNHQGVSMGAHRWVEIHRHRDVAAPLDALRSAGFQLVAAQLCDAACDYREIDYTRPTALIVGNELHGVSAASAARAEHSVAIPMLGMAESYNVSVAAAIILSEAQRQRLAAGLYAAPRLDAQTRRRTFFRWAHPVIARWCERNGVDYPAVDDAGEVVDLPNWFRRSRERLAAAARAG